MSPRDPEAPGKGSRIPARDFSPSLHLSVSPSLRPRAAPFLWFKGFVLFLITALVGGIASAQPALQTVHFTVFSSKPIAGLTFAPRAGATPQKIVFYPTARSPRYEYRGAMPIRFVDPDSGTVVAEATVPPNIRDAMLLFSAVEGPPAAAPAKETPTTETPAKPAPKSDAKGKKASAKTGAPAKAPVATATPAGLHYQVAVLDDSQVSHGAGGLAIINLSGLALSGTVGPQAVTLQPGLNAPLTVGRSAKIALHTTVNKRTLQAYADTVKLNAKQRALLILFPPFYKGAIEVQSRLLIDEPPVTAPAGR